MNRYPFLSSLAVLVLIGFLPSAQASSTIYDGVIESVSGDSLKIRVAHSPYSSVPVHSMIMTRSDGRFQHQHRSLKDFLTYYIDEVPVSYEQFKAFVKPGMRMVTMENRAKWYFIYVSARGQDNHLGFIREVKAEEDTLILERPQIDAGKIGSFEKSGGIKDEDGLVHLTIKNYPHLPTEITLDPDAVVIEKGKRMPWKQAGLTSDAKEDHVTPQSPEDQSAVALAKKVLNSRKDVLVQAARPRQRIELIPDGYGDWDTLVRDIDTGGKGRVILELEYQVLGMITGDAVENKKLDTVPPRFNAAPKIRESRGFPFYRLAGKYRGDTDQMWMPIYYKGESTIVDGFYTSNMGSWKHHGLVEPGRIAVCFQRRGRVTADRFAFSSESPVCWGRITKIEGNRLTVEAPEIQGVPVSGTQTFVVDGDAETFHLGQPIEKAKVLKEGAWIHIYPKRPQTLLVRSGN